jgi:hypothetical protein
MARPRIYQEDRVVTPVRLCVSVRQDLQHLAQAKGMSVNLLITQAVEELLSRSHDVAERTGSISSVSASEQNA